MKKTQWRYHTNTSKIMYLTGGRLKERRAKNMKKRKLNQFNQLKLILMISRSSCSKGEEAPSKLTKENHKENNTNFCPQIDGSTGCRPTTSRKEYRYRPRGKVNTIAAVTTYKVRAEMFQLESLLVKVSGQPNIPLIPVVIGVLSSIHSQWVSLRQVGW